MTVIFDSSVLIDIFNPKLETDHRAKLDGLIASLKQGRTRILIPTPVLAEVMVWAGAAREKYYLALAKSTTFQLAPFDAKAAMECSMLLEDAFTRSEKKGITRTKFKFDWQIAAIAISRGVDVIYSEDVDLERCATRAGIRFQKPLGLPLPEAAKQKNLDLVIHPPTKGTKAAGES
jgi:predicted nucleic acid-binding protein